eukprot:13146238-Alexandrium_andersonii.AAC.1
MGRRSGPLRATAPRAVVARASLGTEARSPSSERLQAVRLGAAQDSNACRPGSLVPAPPGHQGT